MTDKNPYAPPEADIAVDDVVAGELASRWRRLGGAILDSLILGAVLVPILMAFGYFEALMSDEATGQEAIYAMLAGVGLFMLANGYLLATSGQTVAKRLLRMRIVSVHDDRILPLVKVVGLRYIPFWVVGQIPFVGQAMGFINPLFIFGDEKRCLHDLLAGTKVIMVED